MTDTRDQQQKSHLFKKGQSGNPKGRPKGSRHKTTLAALELLEGEASALTRKAIDAALGGDMVALRLCLDKIISPAKDRPISISLPTIKDTSDLPKITGALLAAVASGQIGASEAATMAKLVDVYRGALELSDITERIKKPEDEVKR
jgi:hypothetical protein